MTNFQTRLVDVAQDQRFRYQSYHETDAPLRAQIKKYWEEIGLNFPGVATPWSAVFISWCVFKAGATSNEFKFAPQHSAFVKWAISQKNKPSALFKGWAIDEYAPKLGDIIQNNRVGEFDYDYARTHDSYPSHSTIVVESGEDSDGKYIRTIGGNEGDTVGRRKVRLYANGKLRQPIANHFICVIENLK